VDPLLGIPNLEPASYVKRHRGRPVTNPRNPKLSQETRRLFAHPARCGTVLGLSAVTIGLTILAFKLLGDGGAPYKAKGADPNRVSRGAV
jgi:hypothetical protein